MRLKNEGGMPPSRRGPVNNWLDRYQTEGIEGLITKPGRGRKPVLAQE